MKALLGLVLFTLGGISICQATVWHVDQQGGGDFTTIQAAIQAAAGGDEILVSPGTYQENVDFQGKDLWVRSEAGPESSIIDGGGAGTCATFRSGESPEAVLEGFTLTRGAGTLYQGVILGGAAFCLLSSPTFRGCRFVENASTYAAGIYVDGADSEIVDCVFLSNTAQTYGGAIAGARSRPSIRGCRFEGNYAGTGDGTIHLALSATIENCIFRDNRARAGAAVNAGGFGADFEIRDCVFENNRAHGTHGGAIRVHEASPNIEGCLFVGNSAAVDGGAIIALDGAAPAISSCTFDRNGSNRWGGTLAVWDGAMPLLSHCIIAGTVQAGAVFCSSAAVEATCNDVWGNGDGNYTGECSDPTGIDGNISLDPLFCDPGTENYGIRSDSPCAPANNPECDLIGAFGVACSPPTAVQSVTWGMLKGLYR